MKTVKNYFSILVLATLLFTGCEKDENAGLTVDAIDVSAAQSLSEQVVVDLQTMDSESRTSALKSSSVSDSSIVPSRDRFRFNKADSTSITIDFGAGVLCRDGKLRKGIINIVRALPPSRDFEGREIIFSTEGYEVNGFKVDMTKTVTCLGWMVDNEFPNGYLKFEVVVEDGLIVRPNGDEITVNINHTRKLVATSDSLHFTGWVIGGTSSHSLIRKVSGKTIGASTLIVRELQRPLRYHHFIAGEFVTTFLNEQTVTVDYGTGNLFDSTTWGEKEIVRGDNSMETRNQE